MTKKHMKRCSTLLIIREMQNKSTIKYHLTSVRMTIIKKSTNNKCWRQCREKGTLLHCWWECKSVLSPGRIWLFLKKLKRVTTYDPPILLLGIYPDKTIVEKYICMPMFIAALFTTVKTQKHYKCPSTDEWIKKTWYIYHRELYSIFIITHALSHSVMSDSLQPHRL